MRCNNVYKKSKINLHIHLCHWNWKHIFLCRLCKSRDTYCIITNEASPISTALIVAITPEYLFSSISHYSPSPSSQLLFTSLCRSISTLWLSSKPFSLGNLLCRWGFVSYHEFEQHQTRCYRARHRVLKILLGKLCAVSCGMILYEHWVKRRLQCIVIEKRYYVFLHHDLHHHHLQHWNQISFKRSGATG